MLQAGISCFRGTKRFHAIETRLANASPTIVYSQARKSSVPTILTSTNELPNLLLSCNIKISTPLRRTRRKFAINVFEKYVRIANNHFPQDFYCSPIRLFIGTHKICITMFAFCFSRFQYQPDISSKINGHHAIGTLFYITALARLKEPFFFV